MDQDVVECVVIQKEAYATFLPLARERIEKGLSYLDGALLFEDLEKGLAEGNILLVAILLNNQWVGECLLERLSWPRKRYLTVLSLSGHDVHSWLDSFVRQLYKFTELLEHDGLMCIGRPGWQRVLPRDLPIKTMMWFKLDVGERA